MVVAGGGSGGGAPVLSSGGVGSRGAGGCRESERLGAWEPGRAWKGHFLPSLGSLESLKEPGPQGGPGRPREARNRAKERETPYIYRCIQGL